MKSARARFAYVVTLSLVALATLAAPACVARTERPAHANDDSSAYRQQFVHCLPLRSSAVCDSLQVQQQGAVGALQRRRLSVLDRLAQRV